MIEFVIVFLVFYHKIINFASGYIFHPMKTMGKRNSIMAQMKLIPADNMKDKLWGKRGTPEREAMEAKLKEDVNAYIVGEAIRKARLAQNLTQEQLGERIGVRRAQISKLGKGTSVITLPTMSRVFQALGIATATLDLGIAGKIAL